MKPEKPIRSRITRIAMAGLTAAALLHDPLSAAPAPENLEEVILVYKSHFDIGYTHLAGKVVHSYRTKTIEQALAVVDENKDLPVDQQFVWTIPGWPTPFSPPSGPARRLVQGPPVRSKFLAAPFSPPSGPARRLVQGPPVRSKFLAAHNPDASGGRHR